VVFHRCPRQVKDDKFKILQSAALPIVV